ncbi:phage Mu protein F-like protein [Caballeronia calidae]|uniref:Phage Mu protein F-like protein n=1 Tax=Caballeronia calidae TaxID=1777139 RepID=A0A158A6R1_9BURK|nr:hypothetical protein [Caballeronia calidae]SAK53463.1 phage Mu protein F-like protein [Caballeronia calidae]
MSIRPAINRTFHDVLTEAVRDISENGYDDPMRLQEWLRRLRFAAMADLPTDAALQTRMQMAMEAVFKRSISKTATLRHHPGVSRFTIERITPQLRPELDRRIRASVQLIKLDREKAVETTLSRLSGWATSIPEGGSRAVEKPEVKQHIAKPLRSLSFEERRVAIDQGHKLMSSINAVIAEHTQAIAMMWRSHWRQSGYDYRPDHKERDKLVFALRGSWAMQQGLVNKGAGYVDEMTAPSEEPFCRCYGVYLNNLRDLPPEMLTEKGKRALEETRIRRTA